MDRNIDIIVNFTDTTELPTCSDIYYVIEYIMMATVQSWTQVTCLGTCKTSYLLMTDW